MKVIKTICLLLVLSVTFAVVSSAQAIDKRSVTVQKSPYVVQQVNQCENSLNLTEAQKADLDMMVNFMEDPYCCGDFADNVKRMSCLRENIATANDYTTVFHRILQVTGDTTSYTPCFGSVQTSVDVNVNNLKDCLKKANRQLNNVLKKMGE